MVVLIDDTGRRCDEACYNAKRIGCHCICGGKNHGLGLEHALAHQAADQARIDGEPDEDDEAAMADDE